MRPHRLKVFVLALLTLCAVLLSATSVWAQQVQITPNPSITPSTTTTAWLRWMALGAMALTTVVVLGMAASYMRFAPKFFGREEAPKKLPPGARPPLLTRTQAARSAAGSTRPPVAQSPSGRSAATATQEAATPAAAEPTSGPSAEPAVQADAVGEAEAREPEPRPTAKSAEDAAVEPEDRAAQAPTTAEVATATQEPGAQVPAARDPAAEATAPAKTAGTSELDQETFDRVLEEQLGKGVDRRVAEGRARAAAVVAARKKSQS